MGGIDQQWHPRGGRLGIFIAGASIPILMPTKLMLAIVLDLQIVHRVGGFTLIVTLKLAVTIALQDNLEKWNI